VALPVYDVFVDFGGGEVGIVDSGWFVGAGIAIWEFW
jgi:hypothetical protein